MSKSKKFLSLLMALIMVITIMPLGMITSFASDAFALIGDKRYDLKFDKLPAGVTYDGVNSEIILENASIPCLLAEQNLTIRLKGKNSIYSYSRATVDGSLTHAAIYTYFNVTIVSDEGGSLDIAFSDSHSSDKDVYSAIYAPKGKVFINGNAVVKVQTNLSGGAKRSVKSIRASSLEVASDATLDVVINYNPDGHSGVVKSQLVGVDVSLGNRNVEDYELPFLISTSGHVNIEINSNTPERLTCDDNACVTGYVDLEAQGTSYLSMKTVAGNCILSQNSLPQKLSVVDTATDMNPFEVEDATEHYNFAGTTKDKRFVAVGRNYEGKEISSKEITEAFGTVRINTPLKESASNDKFDMQIEWGNVSEGAVKQIVLGDSIGATATIKIYPKIGYKLSKELTTGDFYYSTAVKYDMEGNTNKNSFLSFSVRFTPTLSQEPAIEMPHSLDKKLLKCNEDFVITAEYTLPEGVTDENVYIEWAYYNADDDMEYPLKNLDGLEGASVKGLGTKTITISGYKKGNAISLNEIWYMVLVLGHKGIGYYTSVPVEIVHNNIEYTDLGKFHSYECSDCGYSPKQGHKYGEDWAYDENSHYHLCACGSKKDVTDHDLTKKYDDTKHWEECLCGFTESKYDHTLGDYIVTKPATETETGLKHKECANCDYKTADEVIEKIPAGHTHSYGDTFEKDANNHWKACSCGEIKDKEAHSFKTVIDKVATETELGARHKVCTICGFETASEYYSISSTEETTTEKPEETTTKKADETTTKKAEETTTKKAEETTTKKAEETTTKKTDETTTKKPEETTTKKTDEPTTKDDEPVSDIPEEPSSEPPVTEPSYKLGDINGDDRITATDARIILRISARLENPQDYPNAVLIADVNGDGKITAVDARKVLRVATRLEQL